MQKILIVEDKASIREGMRDILNLEGYEVIMANHGREGLRMAKKELPDLIISDVTMPEMDGYDMLKELKLVPATFRIPFIFLSGNTEIEYLQKSMNLGADDYLMKPCPPEELLETIKRKIQKKPVYGDQLEELRKNISAAIPHEMITPLNGVIGFAQLLKNKSLEIDLDSRVEMAEAIYNSGNRLLKLVENYIWYTDLEIWGTDKEKIRSLKNEPSIDIDKEVIKIIDRYRSEKNCIIDQDVEALKMRIKPDLFQKILVELLDNAVKFAKPKTAIYVSLSQEQQELVLSITNEGPGMTPEQIEKIGGYMQFDRTKKERRGIGLGLSIVRKIVDMHDGSFLIESVPDDETTAHIRFPAA